MSVVCTSSQPMRVNGTEQCVCMFTFVCVCARRHIVVYAKKIHTDLNELRSFSIHSKFAVAKKSHTNCQWIVMRNANVWCWWSNISNGSNALGISSRWAVMMNNITLWVLQIRSNNWHRWQMCVRHGTANGNRRTVNIRWNLSFCRKQTPHVVMGESTIYQLLLALHSINVVLLSLYFLGRKVFVYYTYFVRIHSCLFHKCSSNTDECIRFISFHLSGVDVSTIYCIVCLIALHLT